MNDSKGLPRTQGSNVLPLRPQTKCPTPEPLARAKDRVTAATARRVRASRELYFERALNVIDGLLFALLIAAVVSFFAIAQELSK